MITGEFILKVGFVDLSNITIAKAVELAENSSQCSVVQVRVLKFITQQALYSPLMLNQMLDAPCWELTQKLKALSSEPPASTACNHEPEDLFKNIRNLLADSQLTRRRAELALGKARLLAAKYF